MSSSQIGRSTSQPNRIGSSELDDASHGCPKPDGSVLFSNPSVFPTVINENMLTRRAFSGASVATHDQAIDGMSR